MKQSKPATPDQPVTGMIVYSTKRVKLSRAQCRTLLELNEPSKDGVWYFTRGAARSLRPLARHGLAAQVDQNKWRVGYRITKLGKDYVRALEKAGVQP